MDPTNIWILATLILLISIYIYLKMRKVYGFWKKKSIVYLKPLPFFGNMLPVVQMKNSIGDIIDEAYWKYPEEKLVGVYSFMEPMLVVRDPILIEKVTIKDFNHFQDQVIIARDGGLFSFTLFQLKGNVWRTLRYKFNPCFTNNKLKLMFDIMLECTDQLLNIIEQNLNKSIEIREILAAYNADITANSVFGIKLDRKANKTFVEMISAIFDIKSLDIIRILILLNFPGLSKLFGLTFLPKNVDIFMRKLIRETYIQTAKSDGQRNHFIQILLNLKDQGSIETRNKDEAMIHSEGENHHALDNIEITDEILDGQAFQFLAGGFEPINNSMMFTMYELARNSDVQEKLRQEVKEVITKNGGYSFEAIKEMKYLEHCILESLRFYPLSQFIFRECTKTYVMDGGLKVDKGQQVAVPVLSIHMDPKYHKEPHKFTPERHDIGMQHSTFFPFGAGPRTCIGNKFAMVEMKLALAKILEHFRVELSPQTRTPIRMNKQAFFIKAKDPIYLILTKV